MSGVVTTATRRGRELLAHVNPVWSVVYGVGAWIVGLLATYALVVVSGADRIAAGSVSALDLAAWTFLAAMGGRFDAATGAAAFGGFGDPPFLVGGNYLPGPAAAVFAGTQTNFYGGWIAAAHAVPFVVVAVAGALLARQQGVAGEGVATRRRRKFLGGATLVVGFAATTLLASLVFSPQNAGYDLGRLLLVAFVYPLVVGGIGAAAASGIKIRSVRGFFVGLLAFLVGYGLFFVVVGPETGAFSGFGDGAELAAPLLLYAWSHGFAGATFPQWWSVLVLVLGGAGLAVWGDAADPIAGAGQGVRVASGYFFATFVAALAWFAVYFEYVTRVDQSTEEALIRQGSFAFGGIVPEVSLVAGLLWAGALGAVGGTLVGAVEGYRRGYATTTARGSAGGDREGSRREEPRRREESGREEPRREEPRRREESGREEPRREEPRREESGRGESRRDPDREESDRDGR